MADKDVRMKGSVNKSKPVYKDGENINKDVPKLKQVKGATEQG